MQEVTFTFRFFFDVSLIKFIEEVHIRLLKSYLEFNFDKTSLRMITSFVALIFCPCFQKAFDNMYIIHISDSYLVEIFSNLNMLNMYGGLHELNQNIIFQFLEEMQMDLILFLPVLL